MTRTATDSRERDFSPYWIAAAEAAMGDHEEALRHLGRPQKEETWISSSWPRTRASRRYETTPALGRCFARSGSDESPSFFGPIEAGRDPEAAERLKRLTGPFILRRLKTDKAVIADLPEKLEGKVLCTPTKEQARFWLREQLLAPVPHRHVVLTIPLTYGG